VETVLQTNVLRSANVIFAESVVGQTPFCAACSNYLLVFARAVVLFQLLVEDTADFAQLSPLDAVINLLVHCSGRTLVILSHLLHGSLSLGLKKVFYVH